MHVEHWLSWNPATRAGHTIDSRPAAFVLQSLRLSLSDALIVDNRGLFQDGA
jgi:hypothetical protein